MRERCRSGRRALLAPPHSPPPRLGRPRPVMSTPTEADATLLDAARGVTASAAHARGATALAWYSPASRALRVAHAPADDHFNALAAALEVAAPGAVHASAASDDRFLSALSAAAAARGAAVRLERASLFRTGDAAVRAVAGLPFGGGAERAAAGGGGAAARTRWLAGCAALDVPAQAAALGGLANVLLRDGGGSDDGGGDPDDGVGVADGVRASTPLSPPPPLLTTVDTVAETPLPTYLHIDDATAADLGVATLEAHPSAMGVGSAKAGHCLLTLLDRGVTPAGRALVRRWVSAPSRELGVIAARGNAVAWLAARGDALDAARAALRGVRAPAASLSRLRASNGRPNVADAIALVDGAAALAAAAATLAGAAADASEPLPALLAALPAAVAPSLGAAIGPMDALRHAVASALDLPSAAAGGRLAAGGVLPALDALHDAYARLPAELDAVAATEADRVAAAGGAVGLAVSAAYLPQCGFFVRVDGGELPPGVLAGLGDYALAFGVGAGVGGGGGGPLDGDADAVTQSRAYAPHPGGSRVVHPPTTVDGGGPDPDLPAPGGGRRRGRPPPPPTARGAFYRAAATTALDDAYGDLLNRVRDGEACLAAEVARRVEGEHGLALARATRAAAAADAAAALAVVARERDWVRPTLVEEPVLEVVGGEAGWGEKKSIVWEVAH